MMVRIEFARVVFQLPRRKIEMALGFCSEQRVHVIVIHPPGALV